jgi:hypothetical protein
MSASDPLMTAYIVRLDLVAVQMEITAAGAEIERVPLTAVPPSTSVILYCKRHTNVERMIAVVRSEFANAATRATLSDLVSAVLNSAAIFGINILTETEVGMIASDAIERMETELGGLQSIGGLSAINQSVQNDAAAAEVRIPPRHAAIFSWLDGFGRFTRGRGTGCWRDNLAIVDGVSATTLSTTNAIIGSRLTDTIWQLCDCVSKRVGYGERLIVGLLRHLLAGMLHRRTKTRRRVASRR